MIFGTGVFHIHFVECVAALFFQLVGHGLVLRVGFSWQRHVLLLSDRLDFGQGIAVIIDHLLRKGFDITTFGLVQRDFGSGNFIDIGLGHVL